MKKILALVLSLMLVLSCAAFAEEAAETSSLEPTYEGAWVEMDYGLTAYIPAEWLVMELTEEQTAVGIFAYFSSEDGAQSLQISWSALEAETTLDAMLTDLVAVYPDAAIVDVPTGQMIAYADVENNLLVCVALDAVDLGIYTLCFSPADAEFSETASQIAGTFGYMVTDEAAAEETAEETTEE